MKTILLSICFSFLVQLNLVAQWTRINSGTESRLMSVFMTNDSTAYIAGGKDTCIILKTTNAGATWITTAISNSNILNAIYFPSDSVGYAVGNNSIVLKTTNAGSTWNISNIGLPSGEQLVSVCFINIDTGYVGMMNAGSGNSIFKTVNGGTSWSNISETFMNGANSISFPSANNGFAVFGALFKTNDSGNSWSSFSVPEWIYLSVQFLNDTLGYAAGIGSDGFTNFGSIIKTTNSGNAWNNQKFLDTHALTSVFFPSNNIGYCVGGPSIATNSGIIHKTINSGTTWSTQSFLGFPNFLYSVYCFNDSVCFAIGDSGLILKTTDGGGPLGIESERQNLEKEIAIYPNPTSGKLKFSSSEQINSIEIYNILGEKVFYSSSPLSEIDLNAESAGIYILKVFYKEGFVVKKVVKQ